MDGKDEAAMEQAKLDKILDNHKLWLRTDGEQGERANLEGAHLERANLEWANLEGANLEGANLERANLEGANLDFSAFPLWCGGLDVHIDDRQATQLLYHLVRNVLYSKNTSKEMKKICRIKSLVNQANKFHRVDE